MIDQETPTKEIVEYLCLHPDEWFSREICWDCGQIHYYCTECGQRTDECVADDLNFPSREDVFGIIRGSLTTEEKIGKLIALVPTAFQVMDEARETIARLREQIGEK